ncbi:MAG: hypothetical protein Q8R20_01350 [Nanoarchaeota archaeon]|nr:hypothetical protein [Nanoarchaeota archaeon]
MIPFILHILIVLSLGTLLYLIAKTIPRIDDTAPKELSFREHWVTRKVERIDKKIKTSSEKFLRRLGLVLMKWENKVNKKVTRLKEEAAKEASDIFVIEEHASKESPTKPEPPLPIHYRTASRAASPQGNPSSSRKSGTRSGLFSPIDNSLAASGEALQAKIIKRERKKTKNNPPTTDAEGGDSSS